MGKKKKPERAWEVNNRMEEKYAREDTEHFISIKKKIYSLSSIQTLQQEFGKITFRQEWYQAKKDLLQLTITSVDEQVHYRDKEYGLELWGAFLELLRDREYTVRHRKVVWIRKKNDEGKEYVTVHIPTKDILKYDIKVIFEEG